MSLRAFIPLASAATLLLAAACAPAAPSPTAAPAKPAATAAPTKPTEPAAAKPAEAKPAPSTGSGQALSKAEGPAASPAAATKPAEAKPALSKAEGPAASPAAKPAGKAADIVVPKPSGDLTVRAGFSSQISFNDLPMWITSERLNKQGWKTETVEFTQAELATEAIAKGDVVYGSGATSSALLANQKGARILLAADQNLNHWTMVSTPAITKCADLNGKRLAIHSQGAVSTAMVRIWVDRTCKGTNPNYIVIAGSQNRAAALINGQIDATPLEMADWISIEDEHPGKYRLLENFSKGLPDLSTTGLYVNGDWVERNKEVAVAYMAELLKTNRMIAEDPKLVEDAARLKLPEMSEKVRPKVVAAYNSFDAFPPNGGLTREKVEGTIKFFTEGGVLQPGLAADKAANLSILEGALAIVGKVPGKP
jgi:NitT/TauT family transport system substrate-binding protein